MILTMGCACCAATSSGESNLSGPARRPFAYFFSALRKVHPFKPFDLRPFFFDDRFGFLERRAYLRLYLRLVDRRA